MHSLINTTKKCFCFVLFASPYLYNKKCVSVHCLIKVHNGKVFLWCIWVRYIMKMWLRCAILSDTQQICGFVVYLIGIHNKITFSLNKHTTKKCTSHIGWDKEIRSGNNKKGKVKLEMGCEPNGGEKWRWQWVGREGGGVGVRKTDNRGSFILCIGFEEVRVWIVTKTRLILCHSKSQVWIYPWS